MHEKSRDEFKSQGRNNNFLFMSKSSQSANALLVNGTEKLRYLTHTRWKYTLRAITFRRILVLRHICSH